MSNTEPLSHYWSKRNFALTNEPRGERASKGQGLSFVIQKHAASRLHYDFRLELDGVLLSWAVPKGPSFDPTDKRMAIHVEDHPLSYADFEGTIPPGQYGAGTVIVWDKGTWQPVGDPQEGLAKGKLVFQLRGHKLAGLWELVRIAKPGEKQEPWLLFKKRDEFATPRGEFDVITELPDSVMAKPPSKKAAGRATATPPTPVRAPTGGAVKASLPATLKPQLATLADGLPATGQWLFELKFDGYRLLTRFEKGKPRLITRGEHDWSAKMPALVKELGQLGIKSGWLDGEIVVLGEDGAPSFNALQKAFDTKAGASDILYYLFDVPFLDGQDLRGLPLRQRRERLQSIVEGKGTEHVRFSAAFETDAASILSSACRMHMEGVIAKRIDAPYRSERTDTWLKLKCKRRQEFVVCGYTDRSDSSAQIGSLLLGVYEGQRLLSVGAVGTGWDREEATRLKRKLASLEVTEPPFDAPAPKRGRWSRRRAGSERWVRPTLVAEVAFAEWTPDQQVRHASYVALRDDKPATEIVRESAKPAAPGRIGSATAKRVQVTHGERIIDASTGMTKLDLVRYYESVAEWMLPHLKGRACSVVRGPEGVDGELFFQKHAGADALPGVTELDPALWPEHEPLLEVASAQAMAGAAQMNVIEFHTWNSRTKNIDKPDRMVFDLDPGEGTKWSDVQEAAILVRAMLTELGLKAWLKTSGGKGLHVVVPLAARLEADAVKAFSKAVVLHLAQTIPSRLVAKSGPRNRVGKLFVDYLRNGHGATTVAAFSARARPGLGVSMPVDWDELSSLKSGAHWTIATAREHLSFQGQGPWADYWTCRQTLSAAMKRLGSAS